MIECAAYVSIAFVKELIGKLFYQNMFQAHYTHVIRILKYPNM